MAPASRNPPVNAATSFFDHASQVQNTGTMNMTVESHATHITSNPSGRTPMEILLSHCALDALVDSKERYDPPKCAPETRDAIQQQIIDWINQLILSGLVMWLTGSAGSGKSAVAQTIAERFNHQETPSTSFFFSRISGSATRVDGDRLIPTIIYQLCLLFPEYKASILKKIETDPAIFQRSRGAQMAALITKPLQQFSFRRWLREFRGGRSLPLLIIIDGLDECRDPQVQCDILRIIADAASSCRNRPLRFLLASRPEAHIARVFNQHPNFAEVKLLRINLDEDQDASLAILTFLRQEFRKIHQQHPLSHHLDPSWPGKDILDLLVSKSSPQFVLASTAMTYVSSPKHKPPVRLAAIINILKTTSTVSLKDQPLEKLDLLYMMIFDGIDEEHHVLIQTLLGIIHLASHYEYSIPPLTAQFLEKLLNLEYGEVCLRLEPLASVLHLSDVHLELPIRSLHASLFDFLLNPSRSHKFALDLIYARAGLIGHNLLKDPDDPATRNFAQDSTIQMIPTFRLGLEGLLTTLLLDGLPSDDCRVLKRPTFEGVLKIAVRVSKSVNICAEFLRSCYAKQALFSQLMQPVVLTNIAKGVHFSPTFQGPLDRFYSKHPKTINFESSAAELKHCIYLCFLPILALNLTKDQLRKYPDLRLHCLLYQVTSLWVTEENMKTWTSFGSAIRRSGAGWARECSEIRELARLCQSKILDLAGKIDHWDDQDGLKELKTVWTDLFSVAAEA